MGTGAGGIAGSGGVFEQFAIWGVLSQLTSPILAPILQAIANNAWNALQSVPLTPETLADMVIKNWITQPEGEAEAKESGLLPAKFDLLVSNAGEPIGLEQILEAYRRGFIPLNSGSTKVNSVETGIRQSRVKDQWASVIEQLAVAVIPVGDAVSAAVKNQISYALAEEIAYYNGISNVDFKILFDTAGNPPGPQELITLARRGYIPIDGVGPDVLSVQQGISEGLTKNKWFPGIVNLMEYLPPPRTITALERAGAIPPSEATSLYQKSGLSPQLAAAYSADASAVKLTKAKTLAEGTVLEIYRGGVIPESEASALLGVLGYSAQESAWILAWEDLHRELAAMNSAVTKVASLYIARKIGQNTAQSMLSTLGLPAAQVTHLLSTWLLERDATVKILTAAEITDAFAYAVMDQPQAQLALESLGYDAYDAWVMLSIKNKAALPNQPPLPAEPTGQLA